MKKSMLVVFACIAMLAGCASTKAPTVTGIPENINWWDANTFAVDGKAKSLTGLDGMAAVGKSRLSGLSGEKAARLDGNVQLAQRLQAVLGGLEGGKNANASGEEESEKFREEVKQFSSAVLVGSGQILKHYDEESGETSVLMFMPYDDLAKNFKSKAMQSNSAMIKDLMSSMTVEEIKSALTTAEPAE